MIAGALESWDELLISHAEPHSLVAIAREGRLVREGSRGGVRVQLAGVDECALALVDLALQSHRNIAFVYPAPAGEVCVLLAAQILLQRFLQRVPSPSVGIVTADTVGAARTWQGLRIAALGSHTRLSEALPCLRATPEGHSPTGRRRFQGVMVGQRFAHWPVDILVVDHLAGSVVADAAAPTIHVFSDPLDPQLAAMEARGDLIWGWTPGALLGERGAARDSAELAPFSVAAERLTAMARGVHASIHVARHAAAEQCISRVRDDLRTLAELFGHNSALTARKGLRVAWQHLSTLASLPCRPSDFDAFAGVPPIAARPTSSFEPEIAAWARVLSGDAAEFATVIASDLGDLRAALDEANPFLVEIEAVADADDVDTAVVVRTHTAARALLRALGGDPNADHFRRLHIRSLRRLHREGTWDRALVVGMPPPWEWHRLSSGLSSDLHVLVLGGSDAHASERMLRALQEARCRWGAAEMRARVWRALLGTEPPTLHGAREPLNDVTVVAAHEVRPVEDPFAPFEGLLLSTPLLVGDEGVEEGVAEEIEPGTWLAAVEAIDVETDAGIITLPSSRVVDVRKGDRIIDVRADALEPGMVLLVGRTEGRLGLLEAMAERLQRSRPDLFAASLLMSDAQTQIRRAFRSSGMTKVQLYQKLVSLGFEKTYHAARGYVGDGGPLAPRDITDLRRLNAALDLGLSDQHVNEIFAGVQRLRVFRRAAGRALAAAARGATVTSDVTRVDQETGLSLADLRDVVLEASVLAVRRRPEPVALAELGRLTERAR